MANNFTGHQSIDNYESPGACAHPSIDNYGENEIQSATATVSDSDSDSDSEIQSATASATKKAANDLFLQEMLRKNEEEHAQKRALFLKTKLSRKRRTSPYPDFRCEECTNCLKNKADAAASAASKKKKIA
jgi:hypothetical protein